MSVEKILRTVVGFAALAFFGSAHAVPVVTYDGASFSLYANTNVGNTITFKYFADFRNITSASTWWNQQAAGLSVDFNNGTLVGPPNPTPVPRGTISGVSSTAAGNFLSYIDKVSANGGNCQDSTNDAVCLLAATNSGPLTTLNGNLLSWTFTVNFLNTSGVFTNDHNLKFLATDGTFNLDNQGVILGWNKTGDLVSKDITIQCCRIPDRPLPEPGTLALLGLGLLGLGFSRRRLI